MQLILQKAAIQILEGKLDYCWVFFFNLNANGTLTLKFNKGTLCISND